MHITVEKAGAEPCFLSEAVELGEAAAVRGVLCTHSGQLAPRGTILCWYLEAVGKPSVGAGSWLFLGLPETGTTGNLVSTEGWAAGGSGLRQEPPWFPAFPHPSPLGFCLLEEAGVS